MKSTITFLSLAAGLSLFLTSASAQQAAPVTIIFDDLPAHIDITDLKRTDDGATMTLRGVATNSSAQKVVLGYTFEMSLIDFKNRRKYMVIQDSAGQCLCSPNGQLEVPATGSVHFWVKFPPAPAPVTSVSFALGSAQPTPVQITR